MSDAPIQPRREAPPPDDGDPGVPEWVVTFGDMMSLLLTFFIMLFSMSEMKQDQQYQDVMDALRKQFGYDKSISSLVPGKLSRPRNSSLAKLSSLGRAQKANTMNGGARVRAPVGENKQGKPIHGKDKTLGGVVYFKEGSDKLSDTALQDLEVIASSIRGTPQKIEVRGHTTNRPLPEGSPFKDHWGLAYARCQKVREFLVKQGVNPRRLRVSTAGGNEPIQAGNDTLKTRENARVEIFTLDEYVSGIKGSKKGGKR